MEQSEVDWDRRLTRQIGKQVAFYRQRETDENGRKLTAVALAERCGRLGFKIDRPAIAKLESGHRQSVSLAEVFVLAEALRVPPAQLLFPVGLADSTEVVPGRPMEPFAAIEWLAGARPDYASPDVARRLGVNSPLVLWGSHLANEHDILSYLSLAGEMSAKGDAEDARRVEDIARRPAVELLRIRLAMAEQGIEPPDLHPVTAKFIGEVSGG